MEDVTKLIAALHEAVTDMLPADVPALLAQLSGLTLALGARLAGASVEQAAAARAECLSLAELAQRLRLGQSTIRKMVDSGEFEEGIHFTRIRRRLIFHWAPIEHMLKSRSTASVAPPAEAVPFIRRGRRRG